MNFNFTGKLTKSLVISLWKRYESGLVDNNGKWWKLIAYFRVLVLYEQLYLSFKLRICHNFKQSVEGLFQIKAGSL